MITIFFGELLLAKLSQRNFFGAETKVSNKNKVAR